MIHDTMLHRDNWEYPLQRRKDGGQAESSHCAYSGEGVLPPSCSSSGWPLDAPSVSSAQGNLNMPCQADIGGNQPRQQTLSPA